MQYGLVLRLRGTITNPRQENARHDKPQTWQRLDMTNPRKRQIERQRERYENKNINVHRNKERERYENKNLIVHRNKERKRGIQRKKQREIEREKERERERPQTQQDMKSIT